MENPNGTMLSKFHDVSPYEGFDASAYEEDIQGWGSDSPVFKTIIERIQPTLIIEVGTWKGASAIHMADILKSHQIEAAVICADTWLGAANHWYRAEWRSHLQLKHGYPSLYYQFLANVVKHGHQDMIIPVPQSSRAACGWFRHLNLSPDIIYLDGSHDESDVYLDCQDYWQLLAPNGVLFGDDYGGVQNKGVKRAVDRFCAELEREPVIVQNKWILTKPE